MKRWLVLLCLSVLAACSQTPLTPHPSEASLAPLSFGSSGQDNGNDVAIYTGLGALYVTGETNGNLDGSPQGSYDAFVRRYDRDGGVIWRRQFGTPDYDSAQSVATDAGANVYVAGYTYGSLAGSRGSADAFVRKYSKSGALLWTRQFGTSESDIAFGVATDKNNNVFVVGSTGGNLAGTNNGSDDAFVSKYNSSGAALWTRQFTFSDYAVAQSVSTDASGNVLVGGYATGLASKSFFRKFNSAGTIVWTQTIDNGADVYIQDVKVQGSYLYVVGFTYGSLSSMNLGQDDAFIRRYATNGAILWTRQFGTSDQDAASGVSIDSGGNAYIVGYTGGSLGGSNQGVTDVFIRKYTPSGAASWTRQFGTPDYDFTGDVATYNSSESYLIGSTSGTLVGTNHGGSDAFLRRISNSSGNPVWTDQ